MSNALWFRGPISPEERLFHEYFQFSKLDRIHAYEKTPAYLLVAIGTGCADWEISYWASKHSSKEITAALNTVDRTESYKSDPSFTLDQKRNRTGLSPLSLAILMGRVALVKELCQFPGIDFSCKDMEGWTVLHHAIASKDKEILSSVEEAMNRSLKEKKAEDLLPEFRKAIQKSDTKAKGLFQSFIALETTADWLFSIGSNGHAKRALKKGEMLEPPRSFAAKTNWQSFIADGIPNIRVIQSKTGEKLEVLEDIPEGTRLFIDYGVDSLVKWAPRKEKIDLSQVDKLANVFLKEDKKIADANYIKFTYIFHSPQVLFSWCAQKIFSVPLKGAGAIEKTVATAEYLKCMKEFYKSSLKDGDISIPEDLQHFYNQMFLVMEELFGIRLENPNLTGKAVVKHLQLDVRAAGSALYLLANMRSFPIELRPEACTNEQFGKYVRAVNLMLARQIDRISEREFQMNIKALKLDTIILANLGAVIGEKILEIPLFEEEAKTEPQQ